MPRESTAAFGLFRSPRPHDTMCLDAMPWSNVNFGKWAGENKSLPQIVFTDPDWFFWASERGILVKQRVERAAEVHAKARAIKIPQTQHGKVLVAEYCIHTPTGRFAGIDLVPEDRPQHEGSSAAWRTRVLDLAVPRSIANYDKRGSAILVSSVKAIVFPDRARVTRALCEAFFDDDANFDL